MLLSGIVIWRFVLFSVLRNQNNFRGDDFPFIFPCTLLCSTFWSLVVAAQKSNWITYQRICVHDDQGSCIRDISGNHRAHNKTWTFHPHAAGRKTVCAEFAYPPVACQAIGYDGPWWLVFVGEPKRSSSTETRRIPDSAKSPVLRLRNLCSVKYTPCLILRTIDPTRWSEGSFWAVFVLPPLESESAFGKGDKQSSWFPRRSHRNSPDNFGRTSEDIIGFLGPWRCSCRWDTLTIAASISRLWLWP